MKDRIEVLGLRVLGTHGVLSSEKSAPQPFELDITVETDFAEAARTDDVAAAVDYGILVDRVRRIVEVERFDLLESLGEAIAQDLLSDLRIEKVTLAIRKLRPPLPADVASVGVRLTRARSGDRA